jgi:TRAP-type C4-dicarboxylate transport system permease small subunit
MMAKPFLEQVRLFSRLLHGIAGISLIFLMLLTIADVTLRAFHRPIPGVYEMVGFSSALAIGLAMPFTSWTRGHVHVDSMLERLPPRGRQAVQIATRLAAAGLFLTLGYNLVRFGLDLRASGEVSPTLEIRFYPVVFGLAAAALLQAVVLLCDIAKVREGSYE